MKKLLISGFTTFSTHSENSSQIIAEKFKVTPIEGFEIRTTVLPVAFSNAFEHLKAELEDFKPDVVICLGLAGNRKKIELEKVAINLIQCDIADNEGVLQKDVTIKPDAPAAYFSTLPLMSMLDVKTPFPVVISFSAGAYVCNYLMYRLLDYYRHSSVQAGFIHLPNLDENEEAIFDSLKLLFQTLLPPTV